MAINSCSHYFIIYLLLFSTIWGGLTAVKLDDGITRNSEDDIREIILHLNGYLTLNNIKNCLAPLNDRFSLKDQPISNKTIDFVVIGVDTHFITEIGLKELETEIKQLQCVRTISYNKKIKANYSTFLNPRRKVEHTVFKNSANEGMRNMKTDTAPKADLKRELFLRGDYTNLYDDLELWKYHDEGFTGKGVKIAIFDSGISKHAEPQLNIAAKIDFTNDSENDDATSHGTFIASVIGSKNNKCPGIAPEAELYIFKVFNKDHESYTEWFLNAFNYAIEKGIDIINLSNGSSDFQDNPFIDKINEITGKGITVVSSIGNDGPEQGTLNNPADMTNVIGVGSLNQAKNNLAHFSSRGITTWNLLNEVGIIKPDVITLGEKIGGLDQTGLCTVSSGTSVSSGIITGSL